jgi:hypothetical protein
MEPSAAPAAPARIIQKKREKKVLKLKDGTELSTHIKEDTVAATAVTATPTPSSSSIEDKTASPQEKHFRKCVDVFRKVERNKLSMEGNVTSCMSVCAYHACCHMHEVTVLDLQWGAIGDEGAIRIAEGLDKNTFVKELRLGGCGIGVRGAKRIGEMLEKNASLVEIDLDCEFPLNIPHSSVGI